jgi:hypothetical protein
MADVNPVAGQAFIVLWDGTKNRPWGQYLVAKSEAERARSHEPYRPLRDLEDDEVTEILLEASRLTDVEISARHHVSPSTVRFITGAVATGFLVKR